MKAVDYINTLIKEKENLTALCKSHVETIRLLKRENGKLNIDILKKNKKIRRLESNSDNVKMQNELENIKNELNNLKVEYSDLQNKYDDVLKKNESPNTTSRKSKSDFNKMKSEYNELKIKYDEVVKKNEELMRIFDEIENTCNSD